MTLTRRAAFLALAPLLAPRRASAQEAPLVRTEGLRQVSPHVRIIPDEGVPRVPNVGFVVDTGLGARNGAAVAGVAARLAGGRPLFLVTTHVHPEHDLGAHAFPAGTTMLRSADQERDIAEFGLLLARDFAAWSRINAELLEGAEFRRADVTFGAEHVLDLGGVTVRLLALGANHTRGDTGIWVEGDRVLFSGDVVMAPQPSLASPHSTIRHWLTSLDRLEALRPALIVPSHGPTGGAELIAGYRTYFTEVRRLAVRERRAGRGLGGRGRDGAMGDRHPVHGRLTNAARQAYAEAE